MKTKLSKLARVGFFLAICGLAFPASARVKSVSLERTFVGKDIRVLQVEVDCRRHKDAHTLRKVVSQNKPWCSVAMPDWCDSRKIVLARKICAYSQDEFENMIASKHGKAQPKSTVQVTKADSAENLLQEQMLIEEQRIEIEQKMLELRRREVALRKEL